VGKGPTHPEILQWLTTGIDGDDNDNEIAPDQEETEIGGPPLVKETPVVHDDGCFGEADGACVDHHVGE
jgi:hypothetical protein